MDVVDRAQHLRMNSLDVVRLREALGDDLPVALDRGDGRRDRVKLVEVHPGRVVDDPLEELPERRGGEVEIHEDERPPGVDLHAEQAEVLVAKPGTEPLPGGHLAERALEVPRPVVVRATEVLEVGSGTLADAVAPVSADVLEGAERSVVASYDEHRQQAAAVLVEVAGCWHVVDSAGELPDVGPESLVLEGREGR